MGQKIKKLVPAALGAMVGVLAGWMGAGAIFRKEIDGRDETLEKMHVFYAVLNQWLCIRQEGESLAGYFEGHGYKTVAIYGMKELGERLYDELKNSGITVKYVIDKNADAIYTEAKAVTPDGDLEPVDAIIVTAVYYFDGIKQALGQKTDIPVVSLEDVIYGS